MKNFKFVGEGHVPPPPIVIAGRLWLSNAWKWNKLKTKNYSRPVREGSGFDLEFYNFKNFVYRILSLFESFVSYMYIVYQGFYRIFIVYQF